MNELSIELKRYLELKKFHNSVTNKVHLYKLFPNLNSIINDDLNFSGQLYCIIHNIKYPKCKICNESFKFISFKRGFLKYCIHKCDKKLIKGQDKTYVRENCVDDILVCEKHNTYVTQKIFQTANNNKCECLCEKCSSEIKKLAIQNDVIANKSLQFIKQSLNNRKILSFDYIKTYFPYLYLKILNINHIRPDTFKNKLYYLLYEYDLKCTNEGCNNLVNFDKYGKPKKLCNECIKQHNNKLHKQNHNVISNKFWLNYINDNFHKNLKQENIKTDKFNIYITNYCEHRNNLTISKLTLKSINQKGIYSLCKECNKQYYKNIDIDINVNVLKDNWNKIKFLSSDDLLNYNPNIWYLINKHKENYHCSFSESKYMLKYDIEKRPKCHCCNEDAIFSNDAYGYLDSCEKHKYNHFVSNAEKEIRVFISSLNIKYESNNRSLLGKELDIYIEDKKIAIEYNGLYWHSELKCEKIDNYNKYKLCKDKDIQLLTIWSDDWKYKQELIKSIIKNKFGLSDKIYARKCNIKIVDFKTTKDFLNNNHLQGWCQSSINIGLYYNNELVSLMTFGKKRMIMNQKSNGAEYELLRFCNILNTSVIGGASKLFKYFVDNYKPTKVISLANCDISDGNLYKMLGFKEIGHVGLNYWWSDFNIKYHRSNFMKHKLIKEGFDVNKTEDQIMRERGFIKIFGTGNLKYEKTF